MSAAQYKSRITEKAKELGFDTVGFTVARMGDGHVTGLREFIAEERYGDMQWMAERRHHREQPQNLWPDAVSVIALGLNYGPSHDPLTLLDYPDYANISVYARGKDYHDIVKKKLKALGRWMAQEFTCDLKVFVDTAPVPEKPLAAQAGLGWQGKHTNVVSPDFGSWLFLGAIYTTLALDPDTPHRDQCGSCRACLDICPTNAFTAERKIDARRCISYLTIEHKGMIDPSFMEQMGNRIYGCDDCLAACPWNKFAKRASESGFHARAELGAPPIKDLLDLEDADFRTVFSGSPIKRIGRNRFIRNVLVAAGNSGDRSLLPKIERLCADPDPVVAETACWAQKRLQD
ncbi:epoxyqueuosine reductase [Kordiimonas sediminis]|uniref:Epoxyqueuosine reductase n=1 Tax=Kordiimonas sediminis TaxID=1735581 RepID=A0A919E5L0_9PROT|nr:tRNA epoxyqueuosine(34) reductase QueG [Kordiimonas sediminis]GHF14556.1 epoxyqueuosine reductase [Kordiimonas sediminis]